MKWVDHIYLKHSDWWTYSPPKTACWYWRAICDVRNKLASGYNGNIWTSSPKGFYSVGSGYKWMCGSMQNVPWKWWVWNRMNVPKHSFICWLIALGRLRTKAHLVQYGVCDNGCCILCSSHLETIAHLFFSCDYSNACMQEIKQWIGVHCNSTDIYHICTWIGRQKTTKFCKSVKYAAICACAYHIWAARNAGFWNNCIPTVSATT